MCRVRFPLAEYDDDTNDSSLHTHECDFYTKSVVSTRSRVIPTSLSVIFIQIEQFLYVKCDFDTHECNLNKHECSLTHMKVTTTLVQFPHENVILTRMSLISTHTSVVLTHVIRIRSSVF
jgi:hypothetical protein